MKIIVHEEPYFQAHGDGVFEVLACRHCQDKFVKELRRLIEAGMFSFDKEEEEG